MNRDKVKCYIYTRVSTAIQVDGYSLDAQRETMWKYADFQNMEIVRLISAMTREGKFKEAIQSKIGTTVDTSDMEKEMAVLSAKLHQAEGIKTRIEQQMDSLDVLIHLIMRRRSQIYRGALILNMIR